MKSTMNSLVGVLLVTMMLALLLSGCGQPRALNDYDSVAYDEARDTVAERQQAAEDVKAMNATVEQMEKDLKKTDPASAQE